MIRNVSLVVLIFLMAFSIVVRAESEGDAQATYRFHFAIHVFTGENRKTYTYELILTKHDDEGKIRALTKVPVRNSDGGVTFIETGTKIDLEYRELKPNQLYLDVEMGFATLSGENRETAVLLPEIHDWQCEFEVILEPGQPLIVSRADALGPDRRYELEVTAHKIR